MLAGTGSDLRKHVRQTFGGYRPYRICVIMTSMSMDLIAAVSRYLAMREERRTGDLERDLVTAAQIAGEWRKQGPLATGAILYALHRHHNYTFMALESLTGIPHKTVHRLVEQRAALLAEGD